MSMLAVAHKGLGPEERDLVPLGVALRMFALEQPAVVDVVGAAAAEEVVAVVGVDAAAAAVAAVQLSGP